MVSALESGSGGPGLSPGRVSANLLLGVINLDGLASHPGGSRKTPSCFMPRKPA